MQSFLAGVPELHARLYYLSDCSRSLSFLSLFYSYYKGNAVLLVCQIYLQLLSSCRLDSPVSDFQDVETIRESFF